jgi:hypothetical protein
MFVEYSDASNIESRMCATDASGRPKWAVSPNFLHLAEIGTDEASSIWGTASDDSLGRVKAAVTLRKGEVE